MELLALQSLDFIICGRMSPSFPEQKKGTWGEIVTLPQCSPEGLCTGRVVIWDICTDRIVMASKHLCELLTSFGVLPRNSWLAEK